MKIALAKSYNLAAVHLLEQVGIQAGGQMVRRFGITNPMAPSLPSALGASEASLLEMVAAYSMFPNKGVRMQPHLIRKVYSRDGTLLEEFDGSSSKVTNEYVALTMVDMMRGVTAGGGTASGASAGGQPLAGKTGTVNNHTDVWFIGYTPTYVTGVWMGNPLRKESLGRGMTGGGTALPIFNAFMNPFMKDKPRESFPKTPSMPSDMRALMERNKREELEKLERADMAAIKSGAIENEVKPPDALPGDAPPATGAPDGSTGTTGSGLPSTASERPVVVKPPPPVTKPPDDKPAAPEGGRRRGKKGDGR
jgi:penicillin-binding protein 1A